MKCVDLFSGCGGLSLGFELAGFEICAALKIGRKLLRFIKITFHTLYIILI